MSRRRADNTATLSNHAAGGSVQLEQAAHAGGPALAAFDARIAGYYDALTPEEALEQRQWGEFATRQMHRIRRTD